MILLIDVGNTSLKYTFEQQGQLSKIKRVNNQNVNAQYFTKYWKNAEKIILASVANTTIAHAIITWAEQANIGVKQVFTPKEQFGLKVGYQQLGVDRWLALLGTANAYPQQNCLVIDLGTATTVDLLRKDGQHLGGWILPGLQTMQQSLLTSTANIKVTSEQHASLLFAKNTSDNVINGCLAATIGAIQIAIKQTSKSISKLENIILVGGNANIAYKMMLNELNKMDVNTVIIDELVFKGLQVYTKTE